MNKIALFDTHSGGIMQTIRWGGFALTFAPRGRTSNTLRALLLAAAFGGGLLFGEMALAIGVF